MKTKDFDYYLPPELIAQKPLEQRDESRLLVLDKHTGATVHSTFKNIVSYINAGDVVVLNDSRVIPARLIGAREDTGGKIELLLLHPAGEDMWECLAKPGKRARPGHRFVFGDGALRAEILAVKPDGSRLVGFSYRGSFDSILAQLGKTPLPPYIKQDLPDSERYQTVYAASPGSVASPTAGLHFTPSLLAKLQEKGATLVFITLHIGLGTFRPVSVDNIHDHKMHAEYFSLSAAAAGTINEGKKRGGRVIAVGTTACRVLETQSVAGGIIAGGSGWTDLFIYPGYEFKMVDALLTNFHLPKSTLVMLVSAFAGRERVLAAYQEAVREKYRFYSFGDAMLII
ncbi:MAG TPA: tRNA preQ1(34) S-adenosylmethionine ribosyltransferase-isomerase QueA [Firmicutes bacterium]|nr:tRNA preQ1(34) S-adenosylmethionine ribosyltransferase-isomerase QueA [Bacillota bacterium]